MWKWTIMGVLVLAATASTAVAQEATAPAQASADSKDAERPKLTFDGDVALWTVAIKPDKTADFERVVARLKAALVNSSDPQRRQQAEGWKVLKLSRPMPDGNVGYVHVIQPVPGADYTVMQILYDELPDERQELYELYRGAFASNLALAVGDIAVDMSQSLGAPAQSVAIQR